MTTSQNIDSELTEFQPPMALDAERHVLAAMLRSDAAIDAATEVIESTDLYRLGHQILFAAMSVMWAIGEPITPVTLLERITAEGDLPSAGGADRCRAYIDELRKLDADPAATKRHGEIVRDRSTRRRALEVGVRLRQMAVSDLSPAEMVARSEDELRELSRRTMHAGVDAPVTVAEYVTRKWERRPPVIPGLLLHEDRVIVVAGEGVGKTTVGLTVGFSAAAGIHPFTRQAIDPIRVCWIDLEMPRDHVHEEISKFHQLAKRDSPGWDATNLILWHRPSGIDLRTATGVAVLTRVLRKAKPDLVIAGPIYKMINDQGQNPEQLHSTVTTFWDQAREQLGCAVWLEHHPPGEQGVQRQIKPLGSTIYRRWPEFGFGLKRHNDTLTLTRFRFDRSEGRMWPEKLERNNAFGLHWPFNAVYKPGTLNGELT